MDKISNLAVDLYKIFFVHVYVLYFDGNKKLLRQLESQSKMVQYLSTLVRLQ